MPLAHFVAEARKNTPVSKTASSQELKVGQISRPVAVETVQKPEIQRTEVKRTMAIISEGDKAAAMEKPKEPAWKACQYLKDAGERQLCKQYMSWCAKEKCKKEFMETGFFDFKKHVKQRKPIK